MTGNIRSTDISAEHSADTGGAHSPGILNGRFFRHDTPNENYIMWSVVTEEECFAVIFQKFCDPLCAQGCFPLLGPEPEADYENMEDGQVYGRDERMEAGITVPLVKEDFHAFTFRFKKL